MTPWFGRSTPVRDQFADTPVTATPAAAVTQITHGTGCDNNAKKSASAAFLCESAQKRGAIHIPLSQSFRLLRGSHAFPLRFAGF
jgi:hypothetical protein